jgi:hypothetical protein
MNETVETFINIYMCELGGEPIEVGVREVYVQKNLAYTLSLN